MKERPILFSGAMVRAIRDGRKTQTRRPVKGWALEWLQPGYFTPEYVADPENHACPYGQPGDRLWVREAFMQEPADYCWEASVSTPSRPATTIYRADSDPRGEAKGCGWKPSIHMPRSACRLELEVTSVRVERLNDCSEKDAIAEGLMPSPSGWWSGADGQAAPTPQAAYALLWNSINGAGSWDANPWVWVVEFKPA